MPASARAAWERSGGPATGACAAMSPSSCCTPGSPRIAELRRRFAREARVLAPLEHEHIVRLYDYGEDGETPFLVMELRRGGEPRRSGARAGSSRGRRRSELARPDRLGARVRARPRDRPPRSHARQRPDRERDRARRRLGLRAGADRPLLDERDDAGDAARHARVLVARAGTRRRQRDGDGHVRARLPALLAALAGGRPSRGTIGSPSASAVPTRRRRPSPPCAPGAPADAVALVDALLSSDPAERPTALERARAARRRDARDRRGRGRRRRGRRARRPPSLPRRCPTAGTRAPSAPCGAEAPARAAGWPLVAAGIAAAGALAFVGATIANADRVVEVPRVTGMTVPQARRRARRGRPRRSRRRAAHGRKSRATRSRSPRAMSIAQAPATGSPRRTRRPRPRRARQPRHGDALPCRTCEGRRARRRPRPCAMPGSQSRSAPRSPGRFPRAASSRATPVRARIVRRPGPIGIVVSSGPPRAAVPDVRGVERRRRDGEARRQLRDRRRRGRVRDGRGRIRPAPVTRPRHAGRARLDRDADGRAAARVGDDMVAERQRLVRLRRDRGHGAAGRSGGSSSSCGRAT